MTEKTDYGTLLSAVGQYLDMMYDGDLSRFDAVFATTAQLHGVQEGQVRVLPAAEYRTAPFLASIAQVEECAASAGNSPA